MIPQHLGGLIPKRRVTCKRLLLALVVYFPSSQKRCEKDLDHVLFILPHLKKVLKLDTMTEEIYVFIARAYYHNGLPAFVGSPHWRLLFEEESFRNGDTVHIRESKAMLYNSVRKSIIENQPELATPKQIKENRNPTVQFITRGAIINLYLKNIINARRESKKTV